MRPLTFAFRRTLRSVSFLLLLLLCGAGIFLSSLAPAAGTPPPAGVCDLCGSEETDRILSFLTENGFRVFSDPEEMEELVRQGELDCALTLPADLDIRIRENRPEGALRFVSTPSSYTPELSRNLAAAALFRELAPYITAGQLTGTDLTAEEMAEAYSAMFGEGFAFSFELLEADGSPIPHDIRSRNLVMGAAAILLTVLLPASLSELTGAEFLAMAGRLGLPRAMKTVLLPAAAVRALLALAVTVLALLAGHWAGSGCCLSLIPAAVIFILLLPSVGLLLSALLPGPRQMHVLLPLLTAAALALCPIFTDPALLFPAAGAVRVILPAQWLWFIREAPLPWLIAAIAAAPLSAGAWYLRCRLTGGHKGG